MIQVGVPGKIAPVRLNGLELYALQPKQWEAFTRTPLYTGGRSPVRHLGYGGSAGAGKSYVARAICTTAALMWPGSKSIIFRQTEAQVLENHYFKFLEELPQWVTIDGERRRLWTWNGDRKDLTFFNGSRTLLGHLGNEKDLAKYQGNDYDVMVFEEATQYPGKWVAFLVGNRLRATVPGTIPFAVYPTNPGGIGHQWYKRLFINRFFRGDEKGERYSFVQAYITDNAEQLARDPEYIEKLKTLPEPYRSWLYLGDWNAGAGAALGELARAVHLVPEFEVPRYWKRFGAFDWGFAHPFAFGEYAVTEDGDLFKLQSITGRNRLPHEIAELILAKGVKPERLSYIVAGQDAFHLQRARGENTPTIAEQMQRYGFVMTPANTDRVAGLNNLRAHLAWKNKGPGGTPADPALRFLHNDGNLRCLDQLENIVVDPDNMEDALKVDADEHGEGGDDFYDETRYAVASRPTRATAPAKETAVQAWSPEALQFEMEQKMAPPDERPPENRAPVFDHPEFGEFF